MAEREFDEIKKKLYDHEEPVDTELWPDIQESLRRRGIRRIFYRALSSAAVIAAIFLAINSVDQSKVSELEYFAKLFSSMPAPATVVESTPRSLQERVSGKESLMAGRLAVMAEGASAENVPAADAPGRVQEPAVADVAVVSDAAAEMVALAGEEGAGKVGEKAAAEEKTEAEEKTRVQVEQQKRGEVEATAGRVWYDEWAELLQEEEGSGKRYTMAFTGGLMPGSSASVTGQRIMAVSAADDIQHGYMIEQVSDTKYSLPVNLGVQLQFPVSENLAVGVGVSYTKLRSKFDCLVNKVRYSGQQTLHYIGIPVNVYGKVAQRNRFLFYINGGAMLEKGIRAKYKFSSYKDSYSSSTKMDGLQFSVNAGLGVEYKCADYMGLYFEPNIIYFTNSDIQYCIRTDQPLQIKAELGCRFHF